MLKKIIFFISLIIIITLLIALFKTILQNEIENMLESEIIISNNTYKCENSNLKKAYVLVHGFGDHNMLRFNPQKKLIKEKNASTILDYSYNEFLSLDEIAEDFSNKVNKALLKTDAEKIIVIGYSAGGIIASFSLSKIQTDKLIDLHTIASPLKGYQAPR